MKPRYQVSRSAIELIKRFEGYRHSSAQLADGRWTIGYGHTLTAREGAEVSEQDAEALLIYDLIAVAHSVNEWVYTPLTQNQFDALTAFAFNIGLDNFRGSSVLRRLNEGALIQAACAMELWRKAEFEGEKIVIDALVRRRSAEKTLFLTPTKGWVPAPSPLLRPNLDMDATGVVPRQAPTALNASLTGPIAMVERDEASQERPPAPSDEPPSPAATAAANVSSRLSTIFTADEAANVRSVAESGPALPRLIIEETAGSVLAPFPQALGGEAELAFNLTPPEDDLAPRASYPPKLELVAANESEPSLFDGLEALGGERRQLVLPEAEIEYEPRTASLQPIEDVEAVVGPPMFDATRPARKPKPSFLPAFGLAAAGAALFGGCLFWAINVPRPMDEGVLAPGTVVWLAGIAGVGLIGIAVYMILDRLGREGAEVEHVEATLERDE